MSFIACVAIVSFLFPAGTPCRTNGDCDDSLSCTVDLCDVKRGTCYVEPDNSKCLDDGIFCNGAEICVGLDGDRLTGCGHTGPPCKNCIEAVACDVPPPGVRTVSSRFIEIEPWFPGCPFAIMVTTSCGTQYVGPWPDTSGPLPIDLDSFLPVEFDGTAAMLVDDPADALWLTMEEWDFTVWVTGAHIVPNGEYEVRLDVGEPGQPSHTAPATANTWNFGDIDGNKTANLGDTLFTVQAFQGLFVEGNSRIRSAIDPCTPDFVHSFSDIQATIRAFLDEEFEEVCPSAFECK